MPDPIPADLPYPLLINALTGEPMPPVSFARLGTLASQDSGPEGRRAPNILGWDPNAGDPNDLSQSGWGILFEADADPAIKGQLQPLIDLRGNTVNDSNFFKIFTGNTGATPGVTPGQSAANWIRPLGVSLDTPVDPQNGLPYYLLIVGAPGNITFDFQASLKSQFAVGRLYFDDIEDYGRYAQAVVEYESKSYAPIQSKSAAVWVTRNPGDLATAMLSGAISQEFLPPGVALGTRRNFLQNAFVNEKATKAQLIEILRGNLPGGPPAVIFTGSHGCGYTGADADTQRRMQGSLVTQEWVPNTPANPANQFCADDVPADAKLLGTIGFLFACFSGACPAVNNYAVNPDGSPIQLAPQPMIARLPQALLSHGMLAVIAHIDMAYPYAFQDVNGTPQMQAVRSPLEQIMGGNRAGLAADFLTSIWNTRAAHVGQMQGIAPPATAAATAPDPNAARELAHMTLARDDARNYIVLGDPAAQLRVKDLR